MKAVASMVTTGGILADIGTDHCLLYTSCDYISGMTDKYAITKFKENFMPQAWKVDGY